MRILIIRLSAIGDVLFTLPAYRALAAAYPDAEIDWLVEDKAQSVLEGQGLRRIISYPRKRLKVDPGRPESASDALLALERHVTALRTDRYDVALDFQGNLKSGVQLALTRARRKIGFARGHCKDVGYLFAREAVRPRSDRQHRVAKALDLAAVLGARAVAPPHLALHPAVRTQAHALIGERDDERPLVVVHPGTSAFGAFKRWTPDRFGRLATLLVERFDARVLVTWGPGEEALAGSVLDSVAETARASVTRAPALRSLLLLAAAIAEADLFIGCDSAPLVLASLVDTPAIGLFGPKDPVLYGPFGTTSEVVRSAVPCSPCARRSCPDVICMAEIEPAMVLAAAERVMATV